MPFVPKMDLVLTRANRGVWRSLWHRIPPSVERGDWVVWRHAWEAMLEDWEFAGHDQEVLSAAKAADAHASHYLEIDAEHPAATWWRGVAIMVTQLLARTNRDAENAVWAAEECIADLPITQRRHPPGE